MALSDHDLQDLAAVFLEAEYNTRAFNPSFLGGFPTISMQLGRLQDAADRLTVIEQHLKIKEAKLKDQLQSWRVRNSNQVIRGLRAPDPRWRPGRKCLARRDKGAIVKCDLYTTPRRVPRSHTLSPQSKRTKIDFETHDHFIRTQISGIVALSTIIIDCRAVLSLRMRACSTLSKIGDKLSRGIFTAVDGEKLGMAYEEIVDGSAELAEISGMIEVLEENL